MIAQNAFQRHRKSDCARNTVFRCIAEMENPSLLHAKLGAYLAQEKYGVKDEEIILWRLVVIQQDVRE